MKLGDVIGCAVDFEKRIMSFSHNGSFKAPMGETFHNFTYLCGLRAGLVSSAPWVSKFIFGGENDKFVFVPPKGLILDSLFCCLVIFIT